MKLTLEKAKRLMAAHGGSLDLRGTGVTSLPEGLSVNGFLNLNYTGVTSLPKGLVVGGWLDLRYTGITSLPEGLAVGSSLYLSHTGITSLPEGLTVSGSLYLNGTDITSLPEDLTVSGWLDLRHTSIASLPEGLTVGEQIYMDGRTAPDGSYRRLQDGDYVPGRYIYADGILTHVKSEKRVGGYTVYVGRFKGRNVASDGKHYAHCDKIRDGIADLVFKSAADRGSAQYRGLDLDSEIPLDEAKTMYRVITGACRQGTEDFIAHLGADLKLRYTVREILELTEGQYGHKAFATFFGH